MQSESGTLRSPCLARVHFGRASWQQRVGSLRQVHWLILLHPAPLPPPRP